MYQPWILSVILVLGGCASLPLRVHVPALPSGGLPTSLGYHDYRGVIHCHSAFSHDSQGKVEEIIAAAHQAGLDFVVMTDHITPDAIAYGIRGWRGRTLFVVGAEISKAGGSILGIGLDRFIDKRGRGPREIIDTLKEQEALAVIAYPEKFRGWETSGYDGIEIYNIASDARDEYKLPLLLSFLFLPPRLAFAGIIDRPDAKLAVWDQFSHDRPLVGIAGTNAHNNVAALGRTFGTYEQLFQIVTNHILAETLTEESLLEALRAGHVYVAFDLFGYVSHFAFFAESNGVRALMGETIAAVPDLAGTVILPQRAEIHLLRDGRVVHREKAESLRFPMQAPGIYRVEVYQGEKPWIFSNPIYVRGRG